MVLSLILASKYPVLQFKLIWYLYICTYITLCVALYCILFTLACVYGDPHIITLDGLKYTFNGKGEFILIEDRTDRFILQGRMIPAINSAQNVSRGTVFSAIVAKQNDSDAVQFEINDNEVTLDVLVDGNYVNFEDLFEQIFDNVIVTNLENNTVGATFSGGAYIEATAENGIISVLIVSLPESFKGTTRGLMGIYNDDISDDFTARGSTFSLPTNSSLQELHYQFGVSCTYVCIHICTS